MKGVRVIHTMEVQGDATHTCNNEDQYKKEQVHLCN